MSLELLNTTARVKELPKYNYTGKFKLGPGMSYPIKDYMETFYRPFEKIGVIVKRVVVNSIEEVEPEVKKILDESKKVEEPVKVEETPVETTPEVKEEAPVEEEVKEIPTEEVKEEAPVEDAVKKYTEDELKEMKMDEIKKILEDMGVDLNGVQYKKTVYIEKLLEAQK